MKIAAVGRTSMLYNTIRRLTERGHEVGPIVTAKAQPYYKRKEGDFKNLAEELNARFFLASGLNRNDIIESLKGLDMAVSVNWVSLFTRREIQYFPAGILNAHMGDLPRYRGNACPNWAIINGEGEISLSIHLVEPDRLDCGRIIAQDRMSLTDMTYIEDVYAWGEDRAPGLFIEAADLLRRDPDYTLKYADIDSAESFRCYPRRPEDSRIDWRSPAVEIQRLIRASGRPLDGAFAFLKDQKIIIWRAEPYNDNETYSAVPGQVCAVSPDYFIVATGAGKLKVTEWQCRLKLNSIRQILR